MVNSENVTGPNLVKTLDGFIWKVGILAFVIAGLFHYITVKKIVGPIVDLSRAAKEIKEGRTPSKIEVSTSSELKELAENFNSMAESLHSVQEKREEMLKDIAHELRTPLTNINGYLEALQNGVIDGNPELFGSLLEESRRITRIVELITELNTWNNGIYFSEKPFDQVKIKKVLLESLTSFNLKINDRFTDARFNIEESILLGNQDGLMQVFTNILQNILDYDTEEKLIVNGEKRKEKYFISFSHTGQFIDPRKREMIFDRFYRLEESRSTKANGAGLGLAIAKSIVTAHKGTIGLKTDGSNHTFWIELPLIKK
ncbi:ATP-binding protein [Domibacillus aminovorans]|uniref:ATP-binding protein n=1 Tax=Domibacillus aminovorans TaxID=29332 RepID=UPI003D220814